MPLPLGIPWDYRWRLLLFQPLNLILNSIVCVPYLFSRPFSVEWLPVSPGRTIRVLVFDHPLKIDSTKPGERRKLRSLHIDMHAGGFIAGIPEYSSPLCTRLAKETGAVVISNTYRLAPRHQYPAAIDDVDAVVAYLQKHARECWGADPELITTSGASAGGNLALSLSQQPSCHPPARTAAKGSVVFCASVLYLTHIQAQNKITNTQ
jgi:acetyl esterase/lipase